MELLSQINTGRIAAGIEPFLQGDMDDDSIAHLSLAVDLLSGLESGKENLYLDKIAAEYEVHDEQCPDCCWELEGGECFYCEWLNGGEDSSGM